jgi:hypothetical protein
VTRFFVPTHGGLRYIWVPFGACVWLQAFSKRRRSQGCVARATADAVPPHRQRGQSREDQEEAPVSRQLRLVRGRYVRHSGVHRFAGVWGEPCFPASNYASARFRSCSTAGARIPPCVSSRRRSYYGLCSGHAIRYLKPGPLLQNDAVP